MLAQLNLFSSLSDQEDSPEKKPEIQTRKLSPPTIIKIEETESVPEDMPLPELIETDPVFEKTIQPESDLRKSSRGRKSIKEMSLEAARIEVPSDDILFTKQYYGIGEVAAMFQVNASLLRYWESEFNILKLRKNKKGDRFFKPEDIKNLQLIHHLLRERKYTIEGARDFMKKSKKHNKQFETIESLKKIKSFLLEMKAGLSVPEEN
ncbi:MAG: MerR family transcriptional regulator [Chitinophagaceae bacterium]